MIRIAMALTVLLPATALAQAAADSSAIRATALDYIEGWYAGDGDRMARALHPQLAKRMVYDDPATGKSALNDQTAEVLTDRTRRGGGSNTPAADRRADVRILDIFGSAAVVRVDARDWVDYLQVVRVDGKWLIMNVLWELRPEAKARMARPR